MPSTRPDWEKQMKKISDLAEVVVEAAPEIVRKYRMKAGLTRRNLAQLLDISERIVATWEDMGLPVFPTGKNLVKLISLFGPEFGQEFFGPLNLVMRKKEDDRFPTADEFRMLHHRIVAELDKLESKQRGGNHD